MSRVVTSATRVHDAVVHVRIAMLAKYQCNFGGLYRLHPHYSNARQRRQHLRRIPPSHRGITQLAFSYFVGSSIASMSLCDSEVIVDADDLSIGDNLRHAPGSITHTRGSDLITPAYSQPLATTPLNRHTLHVWLCSKSPGRGRTLAAAVV